MAAVPTIQFTQEQARTITGVSPETLRHWRKAVPYLAQKSGKAARFSFSDLIGLAVTRQLIDTFGVSVGTVHPGIEALFRTLANAQPSALQHAVVVIGTASARLRPSDDVSKLDLAGAVLMVPCDPLIDAMREHPLPGLWVDPQPALPFPPQAVRM